MKSGVSRALKGGLISLIIAAAFTPALVTAQTLEQAVAMAIDYSPELRQAFHQYKAKQEEVHQAKAGYYPEINLDAGLGREWTDSPTTRSDTGSSDYLALTRREAGVTLRQFLFDGFFTSSEVSRTRNEANADQWALYAASEDLGLDVARAYISYLLAEQTVELSKDNLAAHQATYRAVKSKRASGLASISDLSQITGRVAQAKVSLSASINQLEDARIVYRRMTGKLPEKTRTPVPDADLLPRSLSEATRIATQNHPTLFAAGSDIQAALAQQGSAESLFYPKLDLDLSANFNNNLDGVRGENNDAQAMLRLRYNVFRGGRDSASLRSTEHKINEARQIRESTYLDVTEGTAFSWNALTNLREQLVFLREHVQAATQTRDGYEAQFKLGQRTLIDLLDAKNELFQARIDYLIGEHDELLAQYRVLNATGRLLDSLRVTRPIQWQSDGGINEEGADQQ
ncbi:TolC family outer membrane protein [Veronia pacifica]|uniref:Channel protein TolC n=1 Tax=Veronia pacifica TaxID=1080227 RepID=A0A1C3EK47_9GAMM|nr:TolC family outer membrane protein [Veronia pacifica]ODA33611.1 channel protein TolC [Veronia pacifica]